MLGVAVGEAVAADFDESKLRLNRRGQGETNRNRQYRCIKDRPILTGLRRKGSSIHSDYPCGWECVIGDSVATSKWGDISGQQRSSVGRRYIETLAAVNVHDFSSSLAV